jgi:hypothetical protein
MLSGSGGSGDCVGGSADVAAAAVCRTRRGRGAQGVIVIVVVVVVEQRGGEEGRAREALVGTYILLERIALPSSGAFGL